MDTRLNHKEFSTLLDTLFIDRYFPKFIHIPGLGVRMSLENYKRFEEDLYKAYSENGVAGFTALMGKLQQNPAYNMLFEKTKNMIYSHLDTIGLKDKDEKDRYVAGVMHDVTTGKMPKIGEDK
jgi:hypothetical protein